MATKYSLYFQIQTLQIKLLKVITNQNHRTSTNELHNSLEILKVKDILSQEILCFVHNFVSDKLPHIFNNYFMKFNETHNVNTRNQENFKPPKYKTVLGSKTIKNLGAVAWNSLGQNIKSINDIKKFRKDWKKHSLPY